MEKFIWRGEIEFRGTAEEFNKLAGLLEKLPVEVRIPEWKHVPPQHLAGCNPEPFADLLGPDVLTKIVGDLPRMRVQFIKDIPGGIRTAHVHLGDEVALLDRAKFRTLVGQVARALAERRVDAVEDYVGVMQGVDQLAAIPINLP